MSILAPLVITSVTAVAGATQLRQHIPEWDARGFFPLSKKWGKISLISLLIALAFGVLSYMQSNNPVISLIIAVTALFGSVVAFSDSMVRKVPREISGYMRLIGFIIMAAIVLSPDKTAAFNALQDSVMFPRVPTDALLNIVLLGLACTGIFFLAFVKVGSAMIAQISLSLAQIGAFLVVYAPTLWAAYSSDMPLYVKESAQLLLLPLTAIGVVWFFSWAVHDKIGGADIEYMYFLAMTAPFIVGPGGALWGIMIAMIVQLFVHMLSKVLKLGDLRETKNGPIAQMIENRKAAKEGREPKKSKMQRAVAFLPSLVTVTFIILVASLVSS